MKNFYVIVPIALILLAFASFAASPVFFKGYAFVNGTLAPNGTIVEVYVNNGSSPSSSVVVGQGQLGGTREGWYTIGFEANVGDTVTFKLNNLSLIAANGTNTSAQTLVAGGIVTENFNLSVNKSANSVACGYASSCSSGLCVHGTCRASDPFCGDGFCDSGESCSSDNSACSSSQACTNGCVATSTGGGGGGGGGGAAPAATETATVTTATAGSTASVSISQSASLGVEKIEFTPTASASNVQITVTETTASSAGVTVAIPSAAGAVYKYLDIKTTNLPSVSSAKVNFKVPKTWFTSNKIDKSTVALNRFVNNAWSKLPTTLASEDTFYVYYSATAPGFSTFAITGEKVQTQPQPTPTPAPTPQPQPTPAPQPTPTPAPTPQPQPTPAPQPAAPVDYTIGLVIVLIIVVVGGYFFFRPKKTKFPYKK